MKQLKAIIILTGLLILLIGNIGVNVFQHICKEDGVLTSYFIKSDDHHCLDEEKIESHEMECCSKNEKQTKSDCCNDDIQYFKIKLDFFDDPSIHIPVTSVISLPSNFSFEFNETQTEYYTNNFINPPPKLSGKEILILHQVFII